LADAAGQVQDSIRHVQRRPEWGVWLIERAARIQARARAWRITARVHSRAVESGVGCCGLGWIGDLYGSPPYRFASCLVARGRAGTGQCSGLAVTSIRPDAAFPNGPRIKKAKMSS